MGEGVELVNQVHKISLNSLFSKFDSRKEGLSNQEVKTKFEKYGKNILSEKIELPILIKFLLEFNNFFSYLLLLGAGLSFFSEWLVPGEGSIYIAWALLVVTILNAIFTFIQDYKAEQAMKSFRKLMTANVTVFRDGKKEQIDSTNLVPGDIIYLSEGDKITADARLIEISELKVDHSSLTGESEPQLRSLEVTSNNILLSRNMVFSGTLVQSGSGVAIVVATGDNTQIGNIAKITNEVGVEKSHLQTEIGHFIRIISYIAIFLGVSFFALGILVTNNSFWINMVFAIGIIVANVPEGLLPTVTLTLSIAAQKMAKKNVLVKNIDAIETLGSLTVICSDKTGTLTENNLNVQGFVMNDNYYNFDHNSRKIMKGKSYIRASSIPGLTELNDILLLCNNSTYDQKEHKGFGDSIDVSLKKFSSSFYNIEYLENHHKRTYEIPFSSETKYMITVSDFNKGDRAHLKGAPEVILNKCTEIFINGKTVKLSPAYRKKLLAKNTLYAKQGYRIIACASKKVPKRSSKQTIEKNNYCFYGLLIMQDHPRKEVSEAVRLAQKAGIKIIVISGDQATTVETIARQVGIIKSNKPIVINGSDLSKYSDDKLKKLLLSKEILFARSLPKDKLRIVTLLKEMGEIVAVTGDGVNDAPALRKADVGIAMGLGGTEVAKDAADVVLMDDNFASIVNAIKSGRTVYDNIKNFITYILTSNTPEIVPFLMFVLFGWPLALPVLMILAIDLGTDMIPAIGLGMESSSNEIMERKPRDPKSKLLNWRMIARSYGFIGPLETAFSYIIFFNILISGGWKWGSEIATSNPLYWSAVTGFFATIIITQMFNVFACRTKTSSVFTKSLFSNKIILLGLLSEAILLSLIALVPVVRTVFSTNTFPLIYIPLMLLFGLIILSFEEIRKLLYRKFGYFGVDD